MMPYTSFNLVGVLQLHTIWTDSGSLCMSYLQFFYLFKIKKTICIFCSSREGREPPWSCWKHQTNVQNHHWKSGPYRKWKHASSYVHFKKWSPDESIPVMYVCDLVRRKLKPDDMATLSPSVEQVYIQAIPPSLRLCQHHLLGLVQ
jgi:hypothetical protein